MISADIDLAWCIFLNEFVFNETSTQQTCVNVVFPGGTADNQCSAGPASRLIWPEWALTIWKAALRDLKLA